METVSWRIGEPSDGLTQFVAMEGDCQQDR
jgi:hypothetical protein